MAIANDAMIDAKIPKPKPNQRSLLALADTLNSCSVKSAITVSLSALTRGSNLDFSFSSC